MNLQRPKKSSVVWVTVPWSVGSVGRIFLPFFKVNIVNIPLSIKGGKRNFGNLVGRMGGYYLLGRVGEFSGE